MGQIDGEVRSTGLKRSISPDHLLTNERNSKLTKLEVRKNHGNKENFIKRVQSEMILNKHSSFVSNNNEQTFVQSWHQSHRLWSNILTKTLDKTYRIHSNFLDFHPTITKKMRSILFDWLIEVCEVYHLHRETYHLSIAYIDQYLSHTKNFIKNKFQLLGITSLFIAAKIEEIYPPRLNDFSYITDNSYSEEDILNMELDLMNTLNWHINPITSISWLLLYLQTDFDLRNESINKKQRLSLINSEILSISKLTSVHRSNEFLQLFSFVVRLIDLCSLDIEYNHFSKHILVASAIVLYEPNWPVENITGLTNDDLSICREWMKPFYEVLIQTTTINPSIRSSLSIPMDEMYSLQIHNISMEMLENVYEKCSKSILTLNSNRPFRDLINQGSWFPTNSDKKQISIIV